MKTLRHPTHPTAWLRALAALPLVVLLLGGPFVAAIHHHSDAHHGGCAVCVHAATPGLDTGTAPSVEAPSVRAERPVASEAQTPSLLLARLHASRGPPRA